MDSKESFAGLTHIGSKGEAQMVDVSHKDISKRLAIARSKVILGQKVFDLVSANQTGKGDLLSVAKLAGICGAMQTSNLIPLCHNINLTYVRVDLALNPQVVLMVQNFPQGGLKRCFCPLNSMRHLPIIRIGITLTAKCPRKVELGQQKSSILQGIS